MGVINTRRWGNPSDHSCNFYGEEEEVQETRAKNRETFFNQLINFDNFVFYERIKNNITANALSRFLWGTT